MRRLAAFAATQKRHGEVTAVIGERQQRRGPACCRTLDLHLGIVQGMRLPILPNHPRDAEQSVPVSLFSEDSARLPTC